MNVHDSNVTDATAAMLERRAEARKRPEWVAGLSLALLLVAAAALASNRLWEVASSHPPPSSGSVAPVLIAPDLDGRMRSLAELEGQVVLVDFWATWCPPCVASLPGLSRLHERYADRGFTVLAVNQEPEAVARVRAFAQARELPFPVLIDPGSISQTYGVRSLPTSFLVDRQGVVRAAWRGLVSEAKLEAALEGLLAL